MLSRMNVRDALILRSQLHRELTSSVNLAQRVGETMNLTPSERTRLVKICERAGLLTRNYATLCKSISDSNEITEIEVELEE